jgi:predicted transcriptional regulator
MAKEHKSIRISEQASRQLDDLAQWWNETQTGVFTIALDRAWQDEAARRSTGAPAPWRVRPGDRFFPTYEAATTWLESQEAGQMGSDEWYSAEAETWYTVEQIKYQSKE